MIVFYRIVLEKSVIFTDDRVPHNPLEYLDLDDEEDLRANGKIEGSILDNYDFISRYYEYANPTCYNYLEPKFEEKLK